jgi:HAD superfamily hydrolase (TIGR01509 family)
MPKLQALIFDVDGTLAETEELHRAAFNEIFARPGGPGWHWDVPLYSDLLRVTGGKERIAAYIAQANLPPMTPEAIAGLHKAKTAAYTRGVREGRITLRPGVRRLLEEAGARRCRLAIATTTSAENVEALLAACAPLPAFDVIAAGDEVPAKKPAPDIYTLALSRLGLPAEACIAIEDTENGVRAATGAGLRCVVTTSLYGGNGPFPTAAAVVGDLAAVTLGWLETLT